MPTHATHTCEHACFNAPCERRLSQVSPLFGPIFFILFQGLIFFILLNIFIGIICDAFSVCLEERGDISFTHELRALGERLNAMTTRVDPDEAIRQKLMEEMNS